jgi:hypothetical protein
LIAATLAALFHSQASVAAESIEFVQEHLAEVPMDNRYAALPLWGQADADLPRIWRLEINAAWSRTQVGTLLNQGPLVSAGASRQVGGKTRIATFAFFDDLTLSGGTERRPLDVSFARGVPLTLPAAAEFTGLSGSARDVGLGIAFRRDANLPLLNDFQWTLGALWQRVTLQQFAFDYRVLEGPDMGTIGTLDYSATYPHIAGIAGLAWPRVHGRWALTPHLQLVVPLPRRGVVGRITGPGFELRGDTATSGAGKHFGDPSVTAGFDATYRPWNLTLDLGSAISQAVLEPVIHKGIADNWLVSLRWVY